jgi:hypothetical protein
MVAGVWLPCTGCGYAPRRRADEMPTAREQKRHRQGYETRLNTHGARPSETRRAQRRAATAPPPPCASTPTISVETQTGAGSTSSKKRGAGPQTTETTTKCSKDAYKNENPAAFCCGVFLCPKRLNTGVCDGRDLIPTDVSPTFSAQTRPERSGLMKRWCL